MPVCLRQESVPTDYLRQATCITLGVMLNFDAAQQNAKRSKLAAAPYEVSIRKRVRLEMCESTICLWITFKSA